MDPPVVSCSTLSVESSHPISSSCLVQQKIALPSQKISAASELISSTKEKTYPTLQVQKITSAFPTQSAGLDKKTVTFSPVDKFESLSTFPIADSLVTSVSQTFTGELIKPSSFSIPGTSLNSPVSIVEDASKNQLHGFASTFDSKKDITAHKQKFLKETFMHKMAPSANSAPSLLENKTHLELGSKSLVNTGNVCLFSFVKTLEKESAKFSLSDQSLEDLPMKSQSDGSESKCKKILSDVASQPLRKREHQMHVKWDTSTKEKKKDSERKISKNSKMCSKDLKLPSDTRMTVLSEIQHITSIMCKGVHRNINDKDTLLKHFSQFGKVKRISCNPKNSHAIIRFYDHTSAECAKRKGCIISMAYEPVAIFWTQKSSLKKEKDIRNQFSVSEIDDELHSMLEGIEDHNILPRPEELKGRHKLKPRVPSNEEKQIHPKERKTRVPSNVEKQVLPKDKKTRVPSNEEKQIRPKEKKTRVPSNEEKQIHAKEKKTKPASSDSSEESLAKFLKGATHTIQEKFCVLDARDKLLRLGQKKQSDISKARAITGTCPDMCPEKERYGRFDKNCLSTFEFKKISDSMASSKSLEHKNIIKEYSRSSADQEEPLSHELRPPSVLMLTMDYLICNVLDKMEDSYFSTGEWYDFIWNRTRAIRKDITQQHLCDTFCVEIVEKCARFHIHCAEVLCEEDRAVFDPKINDENLTKCLQTLKHLYEDLGAQGIKCPNEGEFRAYDILLSLNEGDTLRHVQNLQVDVRDSAEVRFAVSAAFSLNSKNYVRFFKLIGEASYLNACILHRYFSQVRVRALQVTLKAYCVPNRTEQYPIQDLVEMLKFESVSEAAQFCQMLGLKSDEKSVLLDRLAFVVPAAAHGTTRAVAIIETKRSISVGEVVNQGPLPLNPLLFYQPHESFDCQGYLKKDAYDASDQFTKVNKQQIVNNPMKANLSHASVPSTVTVITTQARSNQKDFSVPGAFVCQAVIQKAPRTVPCANTFQLNTQIQTSTDGNKLSDDSTLHTGSDKPEVMHIVDDIGSQILADVMQSIIKEECEAELDLHKETKDIAENIVSIVTNDVLKTISIDVVNVEVEKKEKMETDFIEQKQSIMGAVAEGLIMDVLQSEISGIIRCECDTVKEEMASVLCKSVFADTLESIIRETVLHIGQSVHAEEKQNWMTHLQAAKEKTKLFFARKVLTKWQKVGIKRRRLEACRNMFPSCPSGRKRKSDGFIFDNAMVISLKQKEASHLLDAGVLFSCIREELSWSPFDLTSIVENNIMNEIRFADIRPKIRCWKLLLVCIEDKTNYNWCLFVKWLCSKFTKGHVKQDCLIGSKICSLYWLTVGIYHKVAICIRSITIGDANFNSTLKGMKENKLLRGTSSILLCVPSNFKRVQMVQKQIVYLLKETPKVPLYCFMGRSNNVSSASLQQSFFNQLQDQKLLLDYSISELNLRVNFFLQSEKLLKAVDWLIKKSPSSTDHISVYLKDFVEDGMVQAFDIIYQDLAHKKSQGILHQDPICIISFFNMVMKDRASSTAASSMTTFLWPPPEVDLSSFCIKKNDSQWNIDQNWIHIQRIMNSLTLPEFDGNSTKLEDAWDYVQQVASINVNDANKLFSSVSHYLQKSNQMQVKEGKIFVPWADIIYECAQYVVSCQKFSDNHTDEEFTIHYLQEDLENLNLPSKWRTLLKKRLSHDNIGALPFLKRKHTDSSSSEPLGKKMPCSTVSFQNSTMLVKNNPTETSRLSSNPDTDFQQGGKIHTEKSLKSAYLSFDSFEHILTENTASQLQTMLKYEKQESESFLAMLESRIHDESSDLDSHLSWYQHSRTSEHNSSNHELSIMTSKSGHLSPSTINLQSKIVDLNDSIQVQRTADKLFEEKLKQLM